MVTEDMVYKAIDTILDDRESYSKSLNYAVNYRKYAKGLTGGDVLSIAGKC